MWFILLLLMNLLYAGVPTFMKVASAELGPYQIVFIRHLLALFAFSLFVLKETSLNMRGSDLIRMIATALVAFTCASLLQVSGVSLSTATTSSFISSLGPFVMILLAFLFLKERFDKTVLGGLLLALIGFFLLSGRSIQSGQLFDGLWVGNLLILLGVACDVSFPILVKPALSRYPPPVIAFYCLLFAVCFLLPLQSNSLLDSLFQLKGSTIGSLIYLGFCGSFLAPLLWMTFLKKMTVTMIAISWFLQPLFGCLFAILFLKETITPNLLLGGGFIFAALAILTKRRHRFHWRHPYHQTVSPEPILPNFQQLCVIPIRPSNGKARRPRSRMVPVRYYPQFHPPHAYH